MARQPVARPLGVGRGRSSVEPAARPTDTFIQPRTPAPVGAVENLAASLSGLNKGLSAYGVAAQKAKVKQDEIDIEKGQAHFEATQKRVNEAVKQGLIPQGASPAFLRGMAQADLRNQGSAYAAFLEEQFGDKAGLADSATAYAQWEAETFQKYAAENFGGKPYTDVDIMEEFMPLRYAARDKIRKDAIAHNIKVREERRQQMFATEVVGIFDRGGSGQEAGQRITEAARNYLSTAPLEGKAINTLLTDLIMAEASETSNEGVLGLAKHIETTPGSYLANTTTFRKAAAAMRDKLAARELREESANRARYNQYLKERGRQLQSELVDGAFSANPDFLASPKLEELRKVDPASWKSLTALHQSQTDRVNNNPLSVGERAKGLLSLVREKDPDARLNKAGDMAESGQLDQRDLTQVMRQVTTSAKTPKALLTMPGYTRAFSRFSKVTDVVTEEGSYGVEAAFAAQEIESDMEMAAQAWYEERISGRAPDAPWTVQDQHALSEYMRSYTDDAIERFKKDLGIDEESRAARERREAEEQRRQAETAANAPSVVDSVKNVVSSAGDVVADAIKGATSDDTYTVRVNPSDKALEAAIRNYNNPKTKELFIQTYGEKAWEEVEQRRREALRTGGTQ